MKQYSKTENYCLFNGNMLDMQEVIEDSSVDSIVTDPPYELNFMNKGWDNSGIAFQKETWEKCLKALKPGGYLLAFGGSRTYHRIACAIEDAGFEIRDTIMWLYGSGFPKSRNLGFAVDRKNGINTQNSYIPNNRNNVYSGGYGGGKTDTSTVVNNEWNGWGTALKPSYEPVIVARKPCEGSCVDNVLKYGVGGINIDECRVGDEIIKGGTAPSFRDVGKKSKENIGIDKLSFGQVSNAKRIEYADHQGRFPANTILTYDNTDVEEICNGMPEISPDKGSAARYFYCAKASKRDRDEGLEKFDYKNTMCDRNPELKSANMPQNRSGNLRKNTHPTVKPTTLMQYLVRLVTPAGGIVLDPFNGSGSTGKAVMYENKDRNKGYKYIGIEMNEEYLEISKARIDFVVSGDTAKTAKETEEPKETYHQVSVFELMKH